MNITAQRLCEVADAVLKRCEEISTGAKPDDLKDIAPIPEMAEAMAFLHRLGIIKLVDEGSPK